MSESRVVIFDTTLRDGEQAPGFSLRMNEKLAIARQLDVLGADVIEAGFPIASRDDADAVRLIAGAVRRPVIAALARACAEDIERAAWSLAPAARARIHTFIATSDLHLAHKLHLTREQCLEAAVDAVRRARRYTDDVQFSAEDATRSDLDFLCRVVEAVIAEGCTTVNLPDTVGYSTPGEIFDFFRTIRERVGNADKAVFSAHCHDDLGMATANTLAAVHAGARQVEVAINGIGERAGNAAFEEVVMAMRVRRDALPYGTAVRTEHLYETSQELARLTGQDVQPNKAIVGRNAFAHEAGIHQDGVLKDRRTYEIMRPQEVGVPATTLVLGKHSGRHAVRKRCEEIGFDLDRLEVDRVYRAMVALADTRKVIADADLREIVRTVKGAPGEGRATRPHVTRRLAVRAPVKAVVRAAAGGRRR